MESPLDPGAGGVYDKTIHRGVKPSNFSGKVECALSNSHRRLWAGEGRHIDGHGDRIDFFRFIRRFTGQVEFWAILQKDRDDPLDQTKPPVQKVPIGWTWSRRRRMPKSREHQLCELVTRMRLRRQAGMAPEGGLLALARLGQAVLTAHYIMSRSVLAVN